MSNKTRKWRSAIAMVLVISMLFSIFPTAAFAALGENDEINYVSIGDSMTNGYGFEGYEQCNSTDTDYDFINDVGVYGDGSYALQFEQYLKDENPGVTVNHTKLAPSALLADDLLYLLGVRETEFDDDWAGYRDYVGDYDDVDMEGLKAHFQNAISEADIMTLCIGNASFGAYLVQQVTEVIGIMGDEPEIDEQLTLENGLALLENEEAKKVVLDIYEDMKEELDAYIPAFPMDINIDALLDLVAYTAASYLVSYEAVLDRIIELNPDVEIILIGLMNTTYGISISGDGFVFEFGEMMDNTFAMLNAYMASVPVAKQLAGEYVEAQFYYADQPAPDFIVQAFDDLAANNWENVDSGRLSGEIVRQRNVNAYNETLRYAIGEALGFELPAITLDDLYSTDYVIGEEPIITVFPPGSGMDSIYDSWGDYTVIGTPSNEYISKYMSVAIYLAIEEAVVMNVNTMDITVDGLLGIAGDIFGALGDMPAEIDPRNESANPGPWTLKTKLVEWFNGSENGRAMCKVYALFKVGNGMSVHPTPTGHDNIYAAVVEAYENKFTAQDKVIETLMAVLAIVEEYYDDAYAYAYEYAEQNGYIKDATDAIDDVIATLEAIDLSGTDMTDAFKAEVKAEIEEIIETLEAAKALILEADVLDQASLDALMAMLDEAGEATQNLMNVLNQAGVDAAELVIVPALEEAYEVLMNEVVPAIVADLEKAIAEGTAWLMDKAQDAIDAVIEALPDMAEFAHDYVLDFLLNNPDDVIAFFTAYGDEIIDVVGEYGEYALAAMGYIAAEYGDEILAFVMENHEEILEVTAMLIEEHGPHAVQLIQVYAEELGYCQAVRDLIADLEDQIADMKAQLEDELKAQLEDLKAELEDLYAQLENASDDVKEQIQNAIEEVEKLIDEVEQKIAEIEAAIAELEAQLAAAQKALEEAIDAVEAVVEAIKDAIEAGVETVEEILAVIEDIVKVAEDTIAGVKTAIDGIVKAVENVVDFVDELIANGIVAAEMIAEIIDTVMDIIDGVKAELEKGDIEAAIEAIRNELTNGYEELSAMLAAIDTAIAEQLDAIVGDLEAALAQAQDEFEEALYNATHGELACDAKTIAVYGGETVATEDGYAAIVAEEWGLTQTEAVDMADVILYQADPQIFVTALLDSVSGDYAANWAKYIGDEAVLAYLEQAKAELKDVLADEYGEEAAAVAEPLVDSFLFAVVEYAVANIETIEYLSRINEDALIVAAGMYNPVQGLSVTYGGETIDIEAMCQYLIEVTDVYNLLYAIAAQNAVFVDVSEAEAAMMSNVDVDSLMARVMELRAEAIALLKEATKALEENDMAKANALMAQAEALYAQVDEIVEDVMPLVESLDSSYATEAGHAYIAAQILAAIEKADHECEWAIDDNEHCYYCVNCGEEFVCGPHEFDGEEDTVCDVCGYERIIIDPTPEITTSSIVVYYLNENNVAIKDTTVSAITTTGSYRFNIPDPIVFNGVEYLFNSLIDKDASDSYEAELEEGRFFVDVDVMPTTSSVLEFVLKYISEATVASIEISSTDHKTNYYVGDALDVTNLKLLVTYTNSQFNYVNVTPAMISGFDTTTAGEKTVTITYEGATTQYTITVSDPGGQGGPICVDSVAISPDSVSLEVGNTEALTANITPANAQIASVVWTSDNDAVATVDQNGVVTAVAKGNATITVTVTDVDDCVETATCVVTVTKTSSGGSFGGGGGGGYIKPAKPEVIVPDNAVADGVTVTVDHIDYLTVNEVKDLVAKDDNLEVIGGRDSGALVAVKPANAVASFAHPVQLTVPVSKSALQNVDDVNKLTLALVTTDAQGNIQLTYVGGNYDASKGTFTAYVNQPGKYVLMEKLDIVKLELTIDRYVIFVNGEPIINDVPSRIVNNRTLAPAARVLHHMGCTVEWLSDTRTVAVTLPNGDVLNLPVDEPIPGFGAAPVIENGRTLVPIAYIADMMDAHVQWVGNDRKVIIVK